MQGAILNIKIGCSTMDNLVMPTHDIIDNRTEKLIDHLNQMLDTSERGRFAVGYLFLSGLTGIARQLLNL